MKKRIILVLISLMTVFSCVHAQAETSGQVYLDPFIGGTISPDRGINLGVTCGYLFDYGLGLDGTVAYRRFCGSDAVQLGVGINYAYPYFYYSYPVIGVGAGVMIGLPQYYYDPTTVDPTFDYKLGYYFRVVPDYADIGVEYRGNLIFMMTTDGTARLWGKTLEHSLCAVFRVYLTH